jgi:hypothetical protein
MSHQPIRSARIAAVVLVASAACASGCQKSAEKSAEKSGEKTEQKPAAKAGCSDKAFKHAGPDFCLEVPEGYAAKPEGTTVPGSDSAGKEVRFVRSDDYGFVVSWGRWKTGDEAVKAYKSPLETDEKIVEEADLPGGGYYRHWTNGDWHYVANVVKGAKSHVLCYVETKKLDVIAASVLACKSIHVD